MRQHGLTVVVPIRQGQVESLRDFLNGIGTDIKDNGKIKFSRFQTVHFMRWVIVPEQVDPQGRTLPAQLVLATNYDGPLQGHLHELVQVIGPTMGEIYGHCKGVPPHPSPQGWVSFLKAHSRRYAAFYVGTVGRGLSQIRKEAELRNGIQSHLAESNPSQQWEGPAQKIRKGIVDWMRGQKAHRSLTEPNGYPFLYRFGRVALGLGVLAVLALLVLGFVFLPWITGGLMAALILFVGIWWSSLRGLEKRDAKAFRPAQNDPERVADLYRREDYLEQNQISHLVYVKAGWVRRFALNFVLWAINLLARTVFNKGSLGGIPSIHFARWVKLDGGRRLLFFSNYGGSWESYLGEFVDRASVGLTGVWSNTVGYPPTKNLIRQGARNSHEFKAWVREHQIETQVWYSAYTNLSVPNINQNTKIREGLRGQMSDDRCKEWLQLL